MGIVLTILHVIVCFILIGVILLQAGRSQGLTGASFGGGNVQSLFGTQAADFLTKATAVAAIAFLLTSIGLDYLEVKKSRSLFQGVAQDSTLDVESVKKALEKLEDENQSEETATAATDSVTEEAKLAGSDLKAQADAIVDSAKDEATSAIDTAAASAPSES